MVWDIKPTTCIVKQMLQEVLNILNWFVFLILDMLYSQFLWYKIS